MLCQIHVNCYYLVVASLIQIHVNNLKQMETIVSNNSKLSWDGWDVLELTPLDSAAFEKNGVYKNNKWNIQKRYIANRNGWTMPDKYKQHE